MDETETSERNHNRAETRKTLRLSDSELSRRERNKQRAAHTKKIPAWYGQATHKAKNKNDEVDKSRQHDSAVNNTMNEKEQCVNHKNEKKHNELSNE